MAVGGLDIGSTGAKLTVLGYDGELLHTGYRDYPVNRNVSAHEVDAAAIWAAVKELLKDAAHISDLTAVGVTSFGESFVLLDEKGEPLLPVMMYTDPRGEEEANELIKRLGNEFISYTAGTGAHSMYSVPKLMWIKKHKPEAFAAGRAVCLIGDYIVFKLTGKRLIDYSLAARTMGLDIRLKKWSKEIFDAAGIDISLFSNPVPSGTDAGAILPDLAAELRLDKSLRAVVCCHDQVAAAIGSNIMTKGSAADGAGTVQCITPVFQEIPPSDWQRENHYPIIPFLDSYCCYAFTFSGGSLVKWFVDQFALRYKNEAADKGVSVYQHMESMMTEGPTGILVLPHFAGTGTPYMDTSAKGVFAGLDLTQNAITMFKAIMEGITFEMRLNIERLAAGGIEVLGLNASGGGAKSKLWLQMKADILGIPVTSMSTDEAGTVGGIMLAGVAAGVYADLNEASGFLVSKLDTYYPRQNIGAEYGKHYGRYANLYDAIRTVMNGS